jgi:hypothetical protein
MKHLIHEGRDILMVKAPESGACTGCVYQYEDSKQCPIDEGGFKLCYDENLKNGDDITFRDDKVFIDDTPEALAEYVTNTLEGTWE